MLPEVGGMNPVTMRIVVDLPAPFGPRKPRTSPRSTPKERSFTATFAPNAFVRFSTLITAFLLGSHTRFFRATSIKIARRIQRAGSPHGAGRRIVVDFAEGGTRRGIVLARPRGWCR